MKKAIIFELILTFVLLQASFAFSGGTLKKVSLNFPSGSSINNVIWSGKSFFLAGESNVKSAIFGKYDLSSNQFKDLSNLLPSYYVSLNDCVWTGKAIFIVGSGSIKAVMGEYIPSTGHFKDLTDKIPYYWKYNLGIAYNGKLLTIVGESADGSAVMGTYDPSNEKFYDLSDKINKNGFLESVASNGKSFLAVGWKTTMPQRSLIISYDPLSKRVTNMSTLTSNFKNYNLGIKSIVWDGSEYVFVSNYAFGKYENGFEDLSNELNAIHLLSFSSTSKYRYGQLNRVNCGNGRCLILGNGVLLVYYSSLNKKLEAVKDFIANYEYVSLTSSAWDGKEFLIAGEKKGKPKFFLFKP